MSYIKRKDGSDLTLEEMPQGLFITDRQRGTVLISVEDADFIINSLENMKEWFNELHSG